MNSRAHPIFGTEDSTRHRRKNRGQLRLTHPVLDSDLSPLARLIPAAVEYFRSPFISYEAFVRLLPADKRTIIEAIREAEEAGFVVARRAARPNTRRHANAYYLSEKADPRREYFTMLPLSANPGQSAARWILRAVYEREQGRAGAIQLPDAIAGRLAGLSPGAVRDARREWQRAGALTTLRRGTKAAPGISALTDSPNRQDERFEADRYSLAPLPASSGRVTVWATEEQHAHFAAVAHAYPDEARKLASSLAAEPQPVEAERAFCQGEHLIGSVFRQGEHHPSICKSDLPYAAAPREDFSGEGSSSLGSLTASLAALSRILGEETPQKVAASLAWALRRLADANDGEPLTGEQLAAVDEALTARLVRAERHPDSGERARFGLALSAIRQTTGDDDLWRTLRAGRLSEPDADLGDLIAGIGE